MKVYCQTHYCFYEASESCNYCQGSIITAAQSTNNSLYFEGTIDRDKFTRSKFVNLVDYSFIKTKSTDLSVIIARSLFELLQDRTDHWDFNDKFILPEYLGDIRVSGSSIKVYSDFEPLSIFPKIQKDTMYITSSEIPHSWFSIYNTKTDIETFLKGNTLKWLIQ